MTRPAHRKREWTTPTATRYGSVKELTQQTKNKEWGGADDVLISNQTLLQDAGS